MDGFSFCISSARWCFAIQLTLLTLSLLYSPLVYFEHIHPDWLSLFSLHSKLILTWSESRAWPSKCVINTTGLLAISTTLHAVVATGYGYLFGGTSQTEVLIAWGCALAPTPHPNQIKGNCSCATTFGWLERTQEEIYIYLLLVSGLVHEGDSGVRKSVLRY